MFPSPLLPPQNHTNGCRRNWFAPSNSSRSDTKFKGCRSHRPSSSCTWVSDPPIFSTGCRHASKRSSGLLSTCLWRPCWLSISASFALLRPTATTGPAVWRRHYAGVLCDCHWLVLEFARPFCNNCSYFDVHMLCSSLRRGACR